MMFPKSEVKLTISGCKTWWLTSVISASQEAETGRKNVGGQSGKKVNETPSQPIAEHGGIYFSFQLPWRP
jgi:hypothetical protein